MKGLLFALFVLLAGIAHGQLILPPVGGEPPRVTSRWRAGTADPGKPVVPRVRSTHEHIRVIDHPIEDGSIDRIWSGPRFNPTTNEFAREYLDQAEMTDAPDILFRKDTQAYTGVNPADLDLAVGPKYVLQVANSTFSILDKGGLPRFTVGINSFLNDSLSVISNGRVIYDPWQQRWVQLWLARRGTSQASLILLVSDDSDPIGEWYIYQFNGITGDGVTAYPQDYDLGYGETAIVASGNQYGFFGNLFQKATLRTWNKGQLYAGTSAQMRTDEIGPTADGVPFAPRAVQLQSTVAGLDAAFVATLPGGGNRLLLWRLSDAFGAHQLTYTAVPVANYVMPPPAKQPGSVMLQTSDCRLTNAVAGPYLGQLVLYTGGQDSRLWFGDLEPRAVNHFYVFNLGSNSLTWEGVMGLPNFYYWIAGAAVDMRGSATWVLARCGVNVPAYLETRFVDWNLGEFSNASRQVRHGESIFNGGKWGSYFDASMDWGDYTSQTAKARTWVFGQVAPSQQNTWNGWLSTGSFDSVPGSIVVEPATGLSSTGDFGGPFAPSSVTYTVTNPGEVGCPFNVLELPDWLELSSEGYGDVLAGTSQTVTVRYSAAANSLGIGNYSGTIRIQNLFTGQVFSRAVSLQVKGRVLATQAVVFNGDGFNVDLNTLLSSDDDRFTVFNDPVTLEASVAVFTYFPVKTPNRFTVSVEHSTERLGLSATLQLLNYQTGAFETVAGGSSTGIDTSLSVTIMVNPHRYVNQVSRQSVGYLLWKPINDEDPASDGWLHRLDYVQWYVVP